MNDLHSRALTDLKRELEAPRLSALRSTLGLAVVSAALQPFADRVPAAGSRRPAAGQPEPVVVAVEAVPGGAVGQERPPVDVVDQWGVQSFPASDPPPYW
jgi:hypothetical protein